MTNLEQSKRLKVAGFPVDMDGHRSGKLYCITTEKDLMEFLKDKVNISWEGGVTKYAGLTIEGGWMIFSRSDNNCIAQHADLTECLVQAVEAVLKGREGK